MFFSFGYYFYILLILKTTHRASFCSGVGDHAGTAAADVEVAHLLTNKHTAAIVAVGADIVERTTGVDAVARHRQLKRGGKSSH